MNNEFPYWFLKVLNCSNVRACEIEGIDYLECAQDHATKMDKTIICNSRMQLLNGN